MSASESRSAAVLELAEEFLGRYGRGERPSVQEYVERHPELAAEIRVGGPWRCWRTSPGPTSRWPAGSTARQGRRAAGLARRPRPSAREPWPERNSTCFSPASGTLGCGLTPSVVRPRR